LTNREFRNGLLSGSIPLHSAAELIVFSREFFVTVVGKQKVTTPTGEVEAWVAEVGLKPDERVKYLLG